MRAAGAARRSRWPTCCRTSSRSSNWPPRRGAAELRADHPAAAAARAAPISAMIERVLTNLLDNAIRHTPAEGAIEVELRAAAAAGCRVTVSDTGPGIPPRTARRAVPAALQRRRRASRRRARAADRAAHPAIASEPDPAGRPRGPGHHVPVRTGGGRRRAGRASGRVIDGSSPRFTENRRRGRSPPRRRNRGLLFTPFDALGLLWNLFCFWFICSAPVRGGTHFLCCCKESKQRKQLPNANPCHAPLDRSLGVVQPGECR